MDDEDFYEYENQPEFIAERDAWDRIGGADIGLGLGGLVNLRKSGYTVEEKFKLIAAATIKIMNEMEEVLSDTGIIKMLDMVTKLPDFEFKNPSAYALGYVVSLSSLNNSNLELDKVMLENIFTLNKEIEDKLFTKIENTDIIRYARLCLLSR